MNTTSELSDIEKLDVTLLYLRFDDKTEVFCVVPSAKVIWCVCNAPLIEPSFLTLASTTEDEFSHL